MSYDEILAKGSSGLDYEVELVGGDLYARISSFRSSRTGTLNLITFFFVSLNEEIHASKSIKSILCQFRKIKYIFLQKCTNPSQNVIRII